MLVNIFQSSFGYEATESILVFVIKRISLKIICFYKWPCIIGIRTKVDFSNVQIHVSLFLLLLSHALFFIINNFFQLSLSAASLFHELSFKMLLRFWLIHISVIIPRHFLYLLNLRPCPDIGLFMSYLCYPFFNLIFISIMMDVNKFQIAKVHLLDFLPISVWCLL